MKRDYYQFSIRSLNSSPYHEMLISETKDLVSEPHIIIIDDGLDPTLECSVFEICEAGSGNHGNSVAALVAGKTRGVIRDHIGKYQFYGISKNINDELFSVLTRIRSVVSETNSVITLLIAWETTNVSKQSYDLMLEILKTNRVILVCAAGNSGAGGKTSFPAFIKHPNIIRVGSHDISNCVSLFTTKNDKVVPDVYAPGRNIFTEVAGSYDFLSGTSYAAAITAGCIQYHLRDDVPRTLRNFYESCNRNAVALKISDHRYYRFYRDILTPYIGSDRRPVNKLTFRVGDIGFYDGHIKLKTDIENGTVGELSEQIFRVWASCESPVLLLSGGIDSMFVYEMISRHTAVRTYTFQLFYQDICINYQDVSNAYLTNPDTVMVEIDMGRFFEHHTVDYYKKRYITSSPQVATHLYMLDRIPYDLTPVFPGDIIIDVNQVPDNKFVAYDYYSYFNNRPLISRILWHNVDIAKTIASSASELEGSLDCYEFKVKLYKHHGYSGLIPAMGKMTGFENLKLMMGDKFNSLRIFDALYRG